METWMTQATVIFIAIIHVSMTVFIILAFSMSLNLAVQLLT